MPRVCSLDRIGLCVDFEQKVHDVLEGDIGGMGRMPAAPARVVADPLFRNIAESPVGGFNTQLGVLAELFYRNGRVEHAKLVGQARVINLPDKPPVAHGRVLALEHCCHGIDVFLLRRVIGVEEEVAEPAWPQDREEEVFDLRTSLHDARLDYLDLMLDGVLAFVLHGAGDHRLVRRLRVDDAWAWDVADLVVDCIELSELGHMPFLLVHQDGWALAGLEGLHFNAGDTAIVVLLVARFPKLAVAVDVVAELHLLAYSVGNISLDEPVKRGLIAVGAGLLDRSDIVGIRQSPGVRREDPFCATIHSFPPVVLGLPKQLMREHYKSLTRKMRDGPILPLGVPYVEG